MYENNSIAGAIGGTSGGGGQASLRKTMGGQQGRPEMTRYSGPEANPTGERRDNRASGANNLRAMLGPQPPQAQPQPNRQARDRANPNARFQRPRPMNGQDALRAQMVQPGQLQAGTQDPGTLQAPQPYPAPTRETIQPPATGYTPPPTAGYAPMQPRSGRIPTMQAQPNYGRPAVDPRQSQIRTAQMQPGRIRM